jgi:hypothetical protein
MRYRKVFWGISPPCAYRESRPHCVFPTGYGLAWHKILLRAGLETSQNHGLVRTLFEPLLNVYRGSADVTIKVTFDRGRPGGVPRVLAKNC